MVVDEGERFGERIAERLYSLRIGCRPFTRRRPEGGSEIGIDRRLNIDRTDTVTRCEDTAQHRLDRKGGIDLATLQIVAHELERQLDHGDLVGLHTTIEQPFLQDEVERRIDAGIGDTLADEIRWLGYGDALTCDQR